MRKIVVGLIIVVSLVLIVLLSFVIYNELPFMSGKKIVLATLPVDPFDPFMGQYMTINYDISRIDDVSGFNQGDTVYVSLASDSQGIFRKESVSNSKPTSGEFIKGKVTSVYGNTMRVEYGIERYYFERNANLPTTNITVDIVLTDSGRAKIIQLLHNGEPVNIDYEEFDVKS